MSFDFEKLRINSDDIKKLSNKNVTKKSPKKQKYKLFVGAIPVDWIAKANGLVPSASKVGIVLWHLVHLKNNYTVALTNKKLEVFGLTRKQKHLGLKALEEAGLVKVQWRANANPIVTIQSIT